MLIACRGDSLTFLRACASPTAVPSPPLSVLGQRLPVREKERRESAGQPQRPWRVGALDHDALVRHIPEHKSPRLTSLLLQRGVAVVACRTPVMETSWGSHGGVMGESRVGVACQMPSQATRGTNGGEVSACARHCKHHACSLNRASKQAPRVRSPSLEADRIGDALPWRCLYSAN